MLRALLILPVAALACGCATVTQGVHQTLAVATPGATGAHCEITAPEGETLAALTAPGQVRIPRARRTLVVRCATEDRAGEATLTPRFSSRSRIQSPLGYAVDGLSGAMWTYPDEIVVQLQRRP